MSTSKNHRHAAVGAADGGILHVFTVFDKELWRDIVHLKTWHKGAFKVLYLRDFQLFDEAGEALASATTSWLIIDMNTRRMVRNPELASSPETAYFVAVPKIAANHIQNKAPGPPAAIAVARLMPL